MTQLPSVLIPSVGDRGLATGGPGSVAPHARQATSPRRFTSIVEAHDEQLSRPSVQPSPWQSGQTST